MAARLGPSATTSCEPRQAWKGAAVAVDSGAGIRLTGRHLKELSHMIGRGVREAEGARLESAYGLKPIEGSNPSLSAMRLPSSHNCCLNRDFHVPYNGDEQILRYQILF